MVVGARFTGVAGFNTLYTGRNVGICIRSQVLNYDRVGEGVPLHLARDGKDYKTHKLLLPGQVPKESSCIRPRDQESCSRTDDRDLVGLSRVLTISAYRASAGATVHIVITTHEVACAWLPRADRAPARVRDIKRF